jgi:hypothetical protein
MRETCLRNSGAGVGVQALASRRDRRVALSDAIHRFHQGPSRQLFSKYDHSKLEFAVAHAIHRGLLSKEEADVDAIHRARETSRLLGVE